VPTLPSLMKFFLNVCIQVADCFHLLQNLIDKMKDIFRQEITGNIFIKDGQIMEREPVFDKSATDKNNEQHQRDKENRKKTTVDHHDTKAMERT
jgi:transposase